MKKDYSYIIIAKHKDWSRRSRHSLYCSYIEAMAAFENKIKSGVYEKIMMMSYHDPELNHQFWHCE